MVHFVVDFHFVVTYHSVAKFLSGDSVTFVGGIPPYGDVTLVVHKLRE